MKVIIVGCTHAGTFAASSILQDNPNAQVTIYERNDNVSFLSCGIALYLDKKVADPKGLFYSSPQHLEKQGAKVEINHDVQNIDTKNKVVTVKNLKTGKVAKDHYDKLVMTTGSKPFIPPIKGVDNKNVYLCKNWHDAKNIFNQMKHTKRITVIGCGMIGAELADSFSDQGNKVYLIDQGKRPLGKYFDKKFTDIITKSYESHNVTLAMGQLVKQISGNGPVTVTTSDGSQYKSDIVILCVGFRPDTGLLQGKVKMSRGAIVTNRYMQTSDPDIFAAGDSAMSYYNPTGGLMYAALATNAVRQGILVGKNIVEPTVQSMGCQASAGLKLYDRTIVAKMNHMNAHQVIAKVNYRPAFMPTTAPVLMSLVYDPKTHRILGGGFMCKHDVSMAANTLSVMIQNHNTIDQLAMVDMLFQPYFDSPFNYMNVLGQVAVAHEAKLK
ncbi:MAG: NADH oxidase [Acetilactobacillus jinshanensis]